MVSRGIVAIVGAGPYGLSLAAHLAAKGVPYRIFGHPMLFWSQIAAAAGERYLKSYCFGTNISSPEPGWSFADYSKPRGLETFEPCSITDFAAYGIWFQKNNVQSLEPVEVERISKRAEHFELKLSNGDSVTAAKVVLATGLSRFLYTPPALTGLPPDLVLHSSAVRTFASFKRCRVAVIGAGQSALEAAALLVEAGAYPELLVRKNRIRWNTRVSQKRDFLKRLRSPISGLGTGPKAWVLTNFPNIMHSLPSACRSRFVKSHLPAEGAWWLRDRVEDRLPICLGTTVSEAREQDGRIVLRLTAVEAQTRYITVDYVISCTGYEINVQRLDFLDPSLRGAIVSYTRAPRLNARFESSVAGLYFVGPVSAPSFGPLFRFVIGAEYTVRMVATHLAYLLSRSK